MNPDRNNTDESTLPLSLGALLGRVGRLISNQLTDDFERAGYSITVEQFALLVHLWQQDGITQQELGQRVAKHKTSINSLINNLEKRNLVKRIEDPTDRRINQIRLTRQAWSLQQPLTAIAWATTKHTVQGIDEQELAICRKVLLQLVSNLNRPSDL
ncbi:MarR family winged helix-turn-helix transcriptional regulator [Spirosoma aerolatum]|uniref:MarR family winged helix-turn-helix transcriptional regulator n=1 Tax=Spirosoma aerolatum TaxID=1211326 RepID=UPI0009AE8973|nr:MarR family winged helix-turn-helix transcriptional regulator [Spirosoma aerolatum]